MRRPADVMTDSADDRILEYLSETDFAPPKEIADASSKNNDYIGRRCRILKDLGLLETPGRGLYRITDLGEEYLSGELDARTLEAEDADDEASEE